MGITKKDVLKVASLARLRFSDEEMELFTSQLDDILRFIDKLNELDTEGISPTSHILDTKAPMRDDNVLRPLDREEALGNAPDRAQDFFRVLRVIEG